ncbi:MAPEG family protein [Sinimarinibacterium sp. NLF-5-8]|uniref:MAPEG family protein n=1 Tax=Sinimarinibacterium sp. NLF-5-8 TaxID=2698684 RepID=UPI00137C383B|nr:MAPEG family protein [Sinimarinibacterium sp. NLF-5-8]QHS11152.1 hypothetical protein GT972_14050 [Sinimarinibacterium sp. NLF-5-8]
MTIALWCVLAAAFLHLPFAIAAKSGKGFSNARPRAYLEALEGWRQRAQWTQLNSLENFPIFAAAVIICHLLAGANDSANLLALAFVALRLVYGLLYIANLATLRSLTWMAAQACVVGLFVIAARA